MYLSSKQEIPLCNCSSDEYLSCLTSIGWIIYVARDDVWHNDTESGEYWDNWEVSDLVQTPILWTCLEAIFQSCAVGNNDEAAWVKVCSNSWFTSLNKLLRELFKAMLWECCLNLSSIDLANWRSMNNAWELGVKYSCR